MDDSLLAGWENFYVITSSSAAGLSGLTFVIVALIAACRARHRPERAPA